jgi:DNA-binding NarL/FixJ family response regulator
MEVLTLVCQGLNNPAIGKRLYMSPKTASVHISHILTKLGVTNRTQAATAAHHLGLDRPLP